VRKAYLFAASAVVRRTPAFAEEEFNISSAANALFF
jgi:hypothetical protein